MSIEILPIERRYIAGFHAVLRWPAPRARAAVGVAVALAVGCYLVEGAGPGQVLTQFDA
jgi:hypothetical protein